MATIAHSALLPANNHSLGWAILASLALHVMIMLQLPLLDFTVDQEPEPHILQVALTPSASSAIETTLPEPEITKLPEPVKPAAPEQTTITKPAPKSQPKPPKETPPAPASVTPPQATEAPPTPESNHATAQAAVADVMTALPRDNPVPVAVAPVPVVETPPSQPQLPPQTGPSQQDLDAARNLYGSLLSRAIAKYKQYPRIAQMRGWEGEVILEVHCDNKGQVLSTSVKKSSGHNVLDEQAMTMVKKASPLPQPPEILRNNKNLVILVPVPFTLEAS